MLEYQLAYSFAPVGYEELARIPVLAREDAVYDYQPSRYILIEGQAIRVRRGGGNNYYLRYNVNLGRNIVEYISEEVQIFVCDD
jgi:hypothetical protein